MTFDQRLSVCEVRGRVRVVWLMISLRQMILHLFLPKKNQELCTRVDFNKVEMSGVRNDIYFAISSFGFSGVCVISCKDVRQTINRLNPGKSDGNGGLITNHFISAGNDLSVYVSLFLSGLLARGVQFRKSFYYVRLFRYRKVKI